MKYFKINDRVRLKQKDANNNYIYGRIANASPEFTSTLQNRGIVLIKFDSMEGVSCILSKHIEKIED